MVAAQGETKPFTLVRAIPDDVFVCATGHYNPERQFLYDYWSDVADAFFASGITEDVLGLLTTQLDEQQRAEFDRIWDRFGGICRSIDWEQLDRGEFVFAERMTVFSGGSANVRGAFPNIVVMVRADESASNYTGLVEMFEAAADEINGLSGSNVLRVVESEKYDAEIHSVNLLGSVPGAPSMEFALTRRGDVIVFSLGGELLEDVLARLADDSAGGRLADDPRFVSAFQQLPEAEDSMVFFDMQNMLRPLEQMFRSIALRARGPGDVTRNTGLNAKASQKNAEALNAYLHGEYQQAYELANAARELEPRDSLVLYNLACFSALVGKRNDALDWLEKAVEAGFYAPSKIASDSDLASLRGDPRFEELVSRAAELARLHSARDIVVNSSRTSEAYRITTQGWQACDRGEYEEALKLAEQALALAPDDPRPRYLAACAHARLGHADQALGDLRKAVDAGFYCPQHISDDPDLASVRERPEYAQALEAARRGAAAHGADDTDTYESLFLNLMTRIMRSARVVDCIAAVEYTEGYTTHQDSIAMLAPDAADDPLYSVFVRGGTV
ncbi:MAG: tetratricopeptide repeat protein, partial [Planctomycetota bacterium]